jgi:hypothetical protein
MHPASTSSTMHPAKYKVGRVHTMYPAEYIPCTWRVRTACNRSHAVTGGARARAQRSGLCVGGAAESACAAPPSPRHGVHVAWSSAHARVRLQYRACSHTGLQLRACLHTGMHYRACSHTGMQLRACSRTGMQCRACSHSIHVCAAVCGASLLMYPPPHDVYPPPLPHVRVERDAVTFILLLRI